MTIDLEIAGLATARLGDRLVQMATDKGLAVIAVTPLIEPEDREAGGQPLLRRKTPHGEREASGEKATEDHSWSPAEQGSLLFSA